MAEWQPWEGEEGNERVMQRRELALPPHLQMFGNKRLLRDALLAVKILGTPGRPISNNPTVNMEQDRLRRDQQVIMRHKAKMLQHFMTDEQVRECDAAAKELFGEYVRKEYARAAKKYENPKGSNGRVSEAEFKYTVKKRKIREKKQWQL